MSTPRDSSPAPLVRLSRATVTRGGTPLLSDADFCLLPGARWAVLGENGAGKTTLLRLLRGELPPDPGGERSYDLPGAGGPQPTPLGLRQRLALVSGDMQDLYAVNEWPATALEVAQSGFSDGLLLYAEPRPEERAAALSTLRELGLEQLSGLRMASLSSGQARAVLLARALACRPDVLCLDECLEGLDAGSRPQFLAAIEAAAAARPALALLWTSHRTAEPGALPACLTLGLWLEGGRIRAGGPLPEVLARLDETAAKGRASLPDAALSARDVLGPRPECPAGFLARVTDADLVLDGNVVLADIGWTIRPGECWAVLGENGAGKSSLLRLLAGELWPSATDGIDGGRVGRVEYGFGLPGAPLDEVRRRIGLVSPAFDRDYGWNLRVDEAVWSGGLGSIGLHAQTPRTVMARAVALLEFFGLGRLAGRRIRSLSRGQFRRVMLARALAGEPALLLLDEPMAGLDARARRMTRELLSRLAGAGLSLVMVTHHLRDLPEQVDRVLELAGGRVAFCGVRAEWERRRADRAGRTAVRKKIP